jgi:hypothetical protein
MFEAGVFERLAAMNVNAPSRAGGAAETPGRTDRFTVTTVLVPHSFIFAAAYGQQKCASKVSRKFAGLALTLLLFHRQNI